MNLRSYFRKEEANMKYFHAERQSVCMGDDCNAPNAAELAYDKDMMLSEFMSLIMKYVPAMSNCRWIIFFDRDRLAVLIGDSDRNYTYELLVPDRKVEKFAGKKIFCKYEY